MHRHEHRQKTEEHKRDRDDRRLEALDSYLYVDVSDIELPREKHLDSGENRQHAADERSVP